MVKRDDLAEMGEDALAELYEAAKAGLGEDKAMAKVAKRNEAIVNFLVGQVLREHKNFDPMKVREAVLKELNRQADES